MNQAPIMSLMVGVFLLDTVFLDIGLGRILNAIAGHLNGLKMSKSC